MNLHTETNQKPLTDYMPPMKKIKFKCKCKKTIYAQWPPYQWGYLRAGISYMRFLHKNDKAISRYRMDTFYLHNWNGMDLHNSEMGWRGL